jgi:hypothetical protein
VLRYPAIFLIGVFFTLGPAPFERLHLAEANQSWSRAEAAMIAGSHSPLKRLPVRPPVHDPSTCVICAILHAPVAMQQVPPIALGPTARLGSLPIESPNEFHFIYIAAEQCRGPPAV